MNRFSSYGLSSNPSRWYKCNTSTNIHVQGFEPATSWTVTQFPSSHGYRDRQNGFYVQSLIYIYFLENIILKETKFDHISSILLIFWGGCHYMRFLASRYSYSRRDSSEIKYTQHVKFFVYCYDNFNIKNYSRHFLNFILGYVMFPERGYLSDHRKTSELRGDDFL